jgi:hypothetical protein
MLVLKHFTGVSTLSGLKLLAADANGNGNINSIDALLIQRFFVGYISQFSAGNWIFEETNIQITAAGEQVTRNIKGICRGDSNGDFLP